MAKIDPNTVHLLAQEVRLYKGHLSEQEKWARSNAEPSSRLATFQRINFWRKVYNYAQDLIAKDSLESDGT